MVLTSAQLATLKASIASNSGTLATAIAQRDGPVISAFYNAIASPAFSVWRTNVKSQEIFDTITWANFTPNDAADGTAIFTNRLLVIQTKQMNLQNMLIGRDIVDMSKSNIRAGLRDAVISLPAGTGGASVSAAGASAVTLLTVCVRNSTVGEKLFTLGSQTTGTVTADVMGFEGNLSGQNILDALDS